MRTIAFTTIFAASTAFAATTPADSLVAVKAQMDSLNLVAQRLQSTVTAAARYEQIKADSVIKAEEITVLPGTDEHWVILGLDKLSAGDFIKAKIAADAYCLSPPGTGKQTTQVPEKQQLNIRQDVLVGVQAAISAALKE